MGHSTIRTALASVALAVACAACGGGQQNVKSGLGSGDGVPPPPSVTSGGGDAAKQPKREISKDARKDYEAAMAFYDEQGKDGWSGGECSAAADRFQAVVRENSGLVEAQYMVGRSFHNCNDLEAAEKYWESALKANAKLVAARTNLASLLLEQMRKTEENAVWSKLEEEARLQLSSALAVDNDNINAYVLYGLVYMEGANKNKNRLDLAKLLLEEGAKRNENFAPLQNARGLYFMRKNNLSEALARFQKAVELDPKFVEARKNVGLLTLGFRKYDTAKEQFEQALAIQPKDYDAYIGLGIALRGLGDLDGAEANYKKAKELDGKRGEAFFNLGVLYKDFRAAKQSDLKASQNAYRTAKGHFQDFLTKTGSAADKADAKDNIQDCDKVVSQLEEVIKSMGASGAGGATP